EVAGFGPQLPVNDAETEQAVILTDEPHIGPFGRERREDRKNYFCEFPPRVVVGAQPEPVVVDVVAGIVAAAEASDVVDRFGQACVAVPAVEQAGVECCQGLGHLIRGDREISVYTVGAVSHDVLSFLSWGLFIFLNAASSSCRSRNKSSSAV